MRVSARLLGLPPRLARQFLPLGLFLGLGLFVSAQQSAQPPATKDGKAEEKAPPPPKIRLEAEKADKIYDVGEPAGFLFVSDTDGEVAYRLTEDGFRFVGERKLKIRAGQTYRVTGKLDAPGFLRIDLKQGPTTAQAAVAYEPTKIQPTTQSPDDFDAFWAGQVKRLASVRLDPDVELMTTKSTSQITVFRIKIPSVEGRTVHGWIAVPKGAGPFPAVLTVPTAGVSGIDPDYYHATLGAVAMNILIHDLPVDYPKSWYDEKASKGLRDYYRQGWDDREKTYFRHGVLAGLRALDYLASRRDVNVKDLAVTGSSQGGALALMIAGLDPRVKAVAVNVPALCELGARKHGRVDSWPHWLAVAPEDVRDKVEETVGYYDTVNFARRFKGTSIHGVGFLDTVCPPTAVYSAYNVLPEPKQMVHSPKMAHGTDPRWVLAREEFWKAQLDLKPVKK